MTTLPTSHRVLRASACIALLGLLVALAPAAAQLPGNMRGLIQDENGDPVPNVTIKITDPERPDFEQVVEGNAKGRYKFLLANATVPYSLTFSAPGYQTFSLNGVKIAARQDTRRNFTMKSKAAAQAEAAAAPTAAPTDIDPEAAAKGGAVETFNKGVKAENAGDFDGALLFYESAVEKNDELGMAHAALSRMYLKKGDHSKAVTSAERALELDSDSDVGQVLYEGYTALGQKDKADAALAQLQAADPEKAGKNLFNEAADHYNNGRMAEAKSGLEKLLSMDPEHAEGNYMLGIVYIGEGNNAGAKEKLEKFLSIAPNHTDAATAKEMLSYIE